MQKHRGTATAAGALALAAALLGGAPAAAQQRPIYKCGSGGEVTYTHVPCSSHVVSPKQPRPASRPATPPQNRAKAMNRARLSPEERQECAALDARIGKQEALVQAKGAALTPEDERPLVQARLRYHELRC